MMHVPLGTQTYKVVICPAIFNVSAKGVSQIP